MYQWFIGGKGGTIRHCTRAYLSILFLTMYIGLLGIQLFNPLDQTSPCKDLLISSQLRNDFVLG